MDIHTLLHPRSIAVVGASANPKKIGHIVLQNLLDAGYTGDIFPINLKGGNILGLEVKKDMNELPIVPDLCILSLPAKIILQELQQAIDHGCKHFVVYTAGFKESGEEGARIEKELQELTIKAGATLLGPNCLGFLHTPSKVNATFSHAPMNVGNLSIISQSGAIASALFDRSSSVHVGLETCATLGNKSSVNENHFLEYFLDNKENTSPIALYLEEISDGKTFMKLGAELSKHRPLLLLKPGKSVAAKHAMQSHTGSIAGEDKVLQAACKQANIIRCSTMESLFDLSMYFSWQKVPTGNRVAIISNAGGPAVVATDLITENGLVLAELSANNKKTLQEKLPRAASVADPIDILGDALSQRYADALEIVLQDKEDVDAVLIILTPQIMTEISETAEIISTLSKKHNMPIVCAFIGHHDVLTGKKILRKHHIPCYDYPVNAIKALSKAYKRQNNTSKIKHCNLTSPPVKGEEFDKVEGRGFLINKGLSSIAEGFSTDKLKKGLLTTTLTNKLLDTYSIPTPQSLLITSIAEGQAFAEASSYPVVLKLVGPELLHKIDLGGVITNINNDQDLADHIDKLMLTKVHLEDEGKQVDIQIQQQITEGVECILGIKHDPQFGPVLMFGAGGTLTELLHDHKLCILPASREQLEHMICSSSIYPLLTGYRGSASVNIPGLLDVIESFITLILYHPRIEQAEINPIIINKDGARAVDPKIILGE